MLGRMARSKADEWAERVERWRGSGLSAAKFARGQDFEPGALYSWASRLKHREQRGVTAEDKERRPRLARLVRERGSVREGAGLVLRAGDIEVLVASDTDRALLRDVLGALRGDA